MGMNILFITRFQVAVEKGGTERITHVISSGLCKLYGYSCFSAYFRPLEYANGNFKGELHLKRGSLKQDLTRYIDENNINVIITQGEFELIPMIRAAIGQRKCKLIAVHHFSPGYERYFVTLKSIALVLRYGSLAERKGVLKDLILFPYFFYKTLKVSKNYATAYAMTDRIVLLSSRFIDDFKKIGKISDSRKFSVIPNALSFDSFIDEAGMKNKSKCVLVVSRLDEIPKRLSLILEIWEIVKRNALSDGWILKIVGDGPHKSYYNDIIRRRNLKDVSLEGRQSPMRYYKESSIFLMTSFSEGWGLTLTEAQQMGCVPIAFDSYKSLHDIITDGNNGFIIPEGDINLYVEKLLLLMTDSTLRNEMSTQGLQSVQEFRKENILSQWDSLFKTLSNL
jgi:glycosyltransferase involved in cell wall biosynthesis